MHCVWNVQRATSVSLAGEQGSGINYTRHKSSHNTGVNDVQHWGVLDGGAGWVLKYPQLRCYGGSVTLRVGIFGRC